MHNSRDGVSEALVKECGALVGTLMVCPARATMVSPPERHPHLSVKDGEHFLEVVPVRRWPLVIELPKVPVRPLSAYKIEGA